MKRIENSTIYISLTVLIAALSLNALYAQPLLTPDAGKLKTKQKIIRASVNRYNLIEENELAELVFQERHILKSRGGAFFRSLLLPGWGQHYAGSKRAMQFFILTEALTVGSYVGFTTWSNWLEDDYRTFAVTHAGIDLNGKDDNYFVDIGNYSNIDDYNQAQLRDRDLFDIYPTNTETFYWQWDNPQNRKKFEDLRIRSDRASSNSKFALAAIFLNHLVSAIHSTLSVYKYNKKVNEHEAGFKLNFMYDHRTRLLALNVSKTLQ